MHRILLGTSKKYGRNIHQNIVYWVDIRLAQKEGFKVCPTRSSAIIVHDTLPAYCIPKVTVMETGEIIYEKVYESLRPLPKISLRNDWMKELGPEVARQSEGSQPNQPKSQTQLSRTVRLVSEQAPGLLAQVIERDVLFGSESTKRKHGETC